MTAGPPSRREAADRVVALVGDRAEAEATVVSGRSALTRFANSAIHQNVADDHVSVRLRVVVDGRSATVLTNRLAGDALDRLVERALAAAALRPRDPEWPGLAPPAGLTTEAGAHYHEAAHRSTPRSRAEVVMAFVDAAARLPGGRELRAAGYCATSGRTIAFANSAGQRLAGRASRAAIEGIHRTATADGKGFEVQSGGTPLDGGRAGTVAAQKALAAARTVDVGPGEWEVVLEPPCVADVCDFVTGQGFNAKLHAEGMSFVRLGERQLDPAISIFDDATDPRAMGVAFDAEGTPRRRLDLVVDGVCVALAHDRRTAARAGSASTGHAVAGGESAGPSPGDVFLQAGASAKEETLEDMVASVERGLLVTDFWYTRILDSKTQVVTGLTRNGTFLIEGGEVVGAVHNLRFTQSYSDALAPGNVVAVGSDARLAGEVEFHVPSLHLRSWSFTGDARG